MKKEEKKEIAVNTSSGAKKVERIEKETSAQGKTTREKMVKAETAKGEAALGDPKTEKPSEKVKKESKAAKARVDKALAKKKNAEKKKEERAKRRAEKKARIEKYAQARKERMEKRRAEREERIRQRAHKKANRNQAASKRRAKRAKEKKEREHSHKGYGGWIAAVVSLGVVSLALATTVTVGAMDMKKTKDNAMTGYKGTMYELTGIMDNVDDDLDRARLATTPAQQSRILTDLLVQTRLAELDLEKLPISLENDRNVTEFINRTASECERMLAKLRHGEALSNADFETLERL